MNGISEVPARGTRPRNRREITIAAASHLFYRRGYANVSLGEIAAETNVGASAIYRHFSGKADLLLAAIESSLAPFDAALTGDPPAGVDSVDAAFERLAECALQHQQVGVLWQREARSLDDTQQRQIREKLRDTVGRLAVLFRTRRPILSGEDADLLAWCSMAALVSVGFHSTTVTHERYVRLLVGLVRSLADVSLPSAPDASALGSPRRADASTRDTLLFVATQLFAEQGFAGVTVDDIGAAAGIAGPSIYSHFESKQSILKEAMRRGTALLREEARLALQRDAEPSETMGLLVDSFVDMAIEQRFVVGMVLSELEHLTPSERRSSRREQRAYIDTWTDVLVRVRPEERAAARIRVQAALLVINDAVQTTHLRDRSGFRSIIRVVARTILALDEQ